MTEVSAGRGSEKKAVSMVVTGLLTASGVALALNRAFYYRTVADVFFSLTLVSTVIVFLHVRPVWEVLQLVVATCLLVLLQTLALKVSLRAMPGLALLGVASLGLLAFRRIWSAGEERRLLHYAFLPPLLLVLWSRTCACNNSRSRTDGTVKTPCTERGAWAANGAPNRVPGMWTCP